MKLKTSHHSVWQKEIPSPQDCTAIRTGLPFGTEVEPEGGREGLIGKEHIKPLAGQRPISLRRLPDQHGVPSGIGAADDLQHPALEVLPTNIHDLVVADGRCEDPKETRAHLVERIKGVVVPSAEHFGRKLFWRNFDFRGTLPRKPANSGTKGREVAKQRF